MADGPEEPDRRPRMAFDRDLWMRARQGLAEASCVIERLGERMGDWSEGGEEDEGDA